MQRILARRKRRQGRLGGNRQIAVHLVKFRNILQNLDIGVHKGLIGSGSSSTLMLSRAFSGSVELFLLPLRFEGRSGIRTSGSTTS